MEDSTAVTMVNIRPDVGVLSVLRHLNYRPWYAIAEFVDNSLDSFLTHRVEIQAQEGLGVKLRVEVNIDPNDGGFIAVRDNAAGIYEHEYQRAFRPADPPPDSSGLSEFGMGMKSAACWFGREFIVRSSALGEPVARTVTFKLDEIVRPKSEDLPVRPHAVAPQEHYTEIVIRELHNPPQGRTIAKIKEHLASIYRVYIREGTLELRFRSPGINEVLRYDEPEVLEAPPDEALIRRRGLTPDRCMWRKDINFDLGAGLKITGFAALRRRGSTSRAGFALFRRKRLIEGSGEDSYRPSRIFGATTTATYQRLFGELHLEGFEVSHTKDGFQWDENEEPFLELLAEELNSDPMPLLDQAKLASYESIRNSNPEAVDRAVTEAVRETAEVLRTASAPILTRQIEGPPDDQELPAELPRARQSWSEIFNVELNEVQWTVTVEVTNDSAVGEWLSVFDSEPRNSARNSAQVRQLGVRLSLSHPFMDKFVGVDLDRVRPFVRLAAAIGLAEITARETGVRSAGEIRRNLNELLRDALSRS